ncbi:hypothetical protein BGZ94_003865, partial [Podila epigama]
MVAPGQGTQETTSPTHAQHIEGSNYNTATSRMDCSEVNITSNPGPSSGRLDLGSVLSAQQTASILSAQQWSNIATSISSGSGIA